MFSSRRVICLLQFFIRWTQARGNKHQPVGDSRCRDAALKNPHNYHETLWKELVLKLVWFFLAGCISGAAGMILVAKWWMETHFEEVDLDELIREKKEEEDNNGDDV